MKRIAVFGGTFNPVHNGHIALLQAFKNSLALDQILVVPTASPPHKHTPNLADASSRLAMCKIAFGNDEAIKVCDIEISRGGISYTIDTLTALKKQYADALFFLLIGADMFMTIESWFQFDKIIRMAVICCAPRNDVSMETLRDQAARLSSLGAKTAICKMKPYPASSSEIRYKIRRNENVSEFLPAGLIAYIQKHNLYKVCE